MDNEENKNNFDLKYFFTILLITIFTFFMVFIIYNNDSKTSSSYSTKKSSTSTTYYTNNIQSNSMSTSSNSIDISDIASIILIKEILNNSLLFKSIVIVYLILINGKLKKILKK